MRTEPRTSASWEAVPPSATADLADLQNIFRYNVDLGRGHVDWNRNGIFEPAGKRVRAYANWTHSLRSGI